MNQLLEDIGNRYNELMLKCQDVSQGVFNSETESLLTEARLLDLPSLHVAVKRLHHLRTNRFTSVNVGGTMGAGKSSLGQALACALGYDYQDADVFHPQVNKDKMRANIRLDDTDRVPFYTGVQAYLAKPYRVSSCSALTDLHRAILYGQSPNALLHKSSRENWSIEKPNHGLLQIIVDKPYEIALDELDKKNKSNDKRQINGEDHFIDVTRESEEQNLNKGEPQLLGDQYKLIQSNTIYPWEALRVDYKEMQSDSGYAPEKIVQDLLELPFSTPDLNQVSF